MIWQLDGTRTRSVSAENPTGAPGLGPPREPAWRRPANSAGLEGLAVDRDRGRRDGDVDGCHRLRRAAVSVVDHRPNRAAVDGAAALLGRRAGTGRGPDVGRVHLQRLGRSRVLDSEMIVVALASGLNSY